MIQETRHSIPEILSRQPLFRALDGKALETLAAGTREYRLHKNEILFQKGASAEGMHIMVMGQIKLFLPSPSGAEKVIQMAGPGDSFGEESVFLDKPCPLTAQATRDGIVLRLGRQSLLDAVDGNREFCHAVMASLCARMHGLIDNMETCIQRSSAQRVAHFLTQQAPDEADSYDLSLDTNKQTIASQLNLAPETFSRVLSQLAREGCIHVKGRHITVTNLHRLAAIAAETHAPSGLSRPRPSC